jgi:hypothetical protein
MRYSPCAVVIEGSDACFVRKHEIGRPMPLQFNLFFCVAIFHPVLAWALKCELRLRVSQLQGADRTPTCKTVSCPCSQTFLRC